VSLTPPQFSFLRPRPDRLARRACQGDGVRAPGRGRAHSLPGYHGWYVALWAVLPALLFLAVWGSVSPGLVRQTVLESPAAAALQGERAPARRHPPGSARAGRRHADPRPSTRKPAAVAPEFERAQTRYGMIGGAAALLLAFAGGAFAFSRLAPAFAPARGSSGS
jgi:phosphate transport system permease protein